MKIYDVIVVGAGHAGCEAALAAARTGADTAILTLHADHVAQMSCNPAIGGIAKGQVVREIDALGGAQGIVAESAAIQFRLLNHTKGPAVWSPRAQCDKAIYQRAMKFYIEDALNLTPLQAEATDFLVEDGRITGVITRLGEVLRCRALVLTTGTFLHGLLHYGLTHYSGGRAGDFPSDALPEAMAGRLKLKLGRLKTGTPPRVLAKTIDFSKMTEQPSEPDFEEFSFWDRSLRPRLPEAVRHDLVCYQVYTTDETSAIARANLDKSPMYSGIIKGIGTRYCPSFEDKVVRFPQHPRHLLYLEPEGAETGEYYINGLATSLPIEAQTAMVHSLPGLENAVLTRYAYAIEYDYLPPEQIDRSLRVKAYPNLFTAGQINGTSGYEEAAGQGVIAGLNAARFAAGLEPAVLGRDTSYIGVMLDDLATKEIREPYRLFTGRAEYRLSLRQENADLRLCEFAWQNHLLPEAKYRAFSSYRDQLNTALDACRSRRHAGKPLLVHLKELKPGTSREAVPPDFPVSGLPELPDGQIGRRIWNELLVEARYDGYLQREAIEISRLTKLEETRLPVDFDYAVLPGLSNEARQKLVAVRPTTLAQAGRIDGVTPTEIALLQVALKRRDNTSPREKSKVSSNAPAEGTR